LKTNYVCSSCGNITTKWFGKCPECDSWNTLEEKMIVSEQPSAQKVKRAPVNRYETVEQSKAKKIDEIEFQKDLRFQTGLNEFDRVLGGGLVEGSVVLISGEPGIGKSTLLLQICQRVGEHARLLYVTGEESVSQIKLRAKRVGVNTPNLLLLSETNVQKIIPEINTNQPDVVIIDSIQTMYDENHPSSPGTVTQVKQSTMQLIAKAKEDQISILIVGHVNKDGAIAGPKVLEHMVDAVLYFEGDKQHAYRIIRAVKNRYGSTNEMGMFEMSDDGLNEIEKPSEMIMQQRPKDVPGSCAVAVMEGSRSMITEIQALACTTSFPSPRRMSSGFDYNRVSLLLAVLEKRLGLRFSTQDVYINIAGGLRIDEPACDAAAALAMISSYKDIPIPDDLIVMGEIGLAGECRSISVVEQRLSQAARLGFKRAAIPYHNVERIKHSYGMQIIKLRSVYDLLHLLNKD